MVSAPTSASDVGEVPNMRSPPKRDPRFDMADLKVVLEPFVGQRDGQKNMIKFHEFSVINDWF